MTAVLADKLEIWGFEDDVILFADGSMGFGLEAQPIDVSSWDDDKINDQTQKISHFLNGLPIGIDIQFIQEITGGNKQLIDRHAELAKDSENEIAKHLATERVNRLLEYDNNRLLPKHSLKIFVRRPFTRGLVQKPKLFAKPKLFQKITEDVFETEILKLINLKDDIVRSLEIMGLATKTLSGDATADLCYEQWNPTRKMRGLPRPEYDSEDIRSTLLFTDVSVSEQGFSLSDMHYRVISLKLMPDQTFASMAQALRDLPFDSKAFVTIHVPDQIKELESLQLQRRLAFSMARGKTTGVGDIESEAKLQDLETLLSEMIAQGEKVFHVGFNVLLRSQDKSDLDNQVTEALLKLRSLSGAEGMEESLASFDIFSEFSLPNARAKERIRRVKTSNLCDLLPIFGPWTGHERPSLLLRSRMGSLISFDPFSQELTNFNQIVSGGSGSGKSYLTTILLTQLYKENPKIFIVDIGASYKKFCDNLNGQYLPLGLIDNFSINPFDLLPDEKLPSSTKIKFLVGLVELMTKEEDDKRLNRLQRTEIEEAIQRVYENSQAPKLSDLKSMLLAHNDLEIRRLGRILGSWCGDTPYGRFVDRSTTIELSRNVVCFDLKGMEAFPELQTVSLYLITDFLWREIQKNRGVKKFIVFDECWKQLETDPTLIAELFRTVRKYLGSCIAISQNIDDFAKSKVATAIMSNAAIKWILMQRGADQARLKEVLQLNDNEMNLIASLHQEKGHYSEAFLMAQDQKAVVAIESTPLEYWIATTDARDLAIFDATVKEDSSKSQLEILKYLSQKYPHGVANAKAS